MHHRLLDRLPLLLLSSLLLTPLASWAQDAAPARPTGAPSSKDITALERAIEAATGASDLDGTRVGIHVVDLATGQELYASRADEPFNPASNAKLVTSAAALDRFGPHHTFTTTLKVASIDGDTVPGDLYVEGDGAGFILYKDVLDWAGRIRARGITTIEGDVLVDDGPFAGGAFLPPGFEQKNEDASYRAPVGAFSVNFNAVTALVSPGSPGGPAVVRLDPPNGHVEVVNRVTTTSGKSRRLSAASQTIGEGEGTRIVVEGTIGAEAATWSQRKRVDNPPLFGGAVLVAALAQVGVTVEGQVRRAEITGKGETTLVRHASEPLVYLLMAMNKWSNNFMAEQVLRDLGTRAEAGEARGTWAGGIAVVQAFLKEAGASAEGSAILNGSGLYTGNLYTPRQLTALLTHMDRHTWAPEYKSTLAVAGVDGTLARRLTDLRGRVRAKTGTLNEVIGLSGYMTTASGREVAFSILFNDPPVRAWRLRPEQDAIARAIAGWEG